MSEPVDGLRGLKTALIVTIVVSIIGPLMFVIQSQGARRENCDRVHDAFVAYTHKLGERLGASRAEIYEFLLEVDPILGECS